MSAYKSDCPEYNQEFISGKSYFSKCTIEAFECKSTHYNVVISEITMFDKNDLKLGKIFWGQLSGFSYFFVFSNKNIIMASVYRQGSRGICLLR